MANQVAGSQTKLAADVEALNSNLQTLNNNIGSKFQVVTQSGGQIANLVQAHTMWIIFAQRATTDAGGCWLVHRCDDDMKVQEITKTSAITISVNSFGTVDVKYGGNSAYVLICAIRLY